MITNHSLKNPPDFTSGVSQDVRHYSVIVEGISSQTVPASSACPTANCSHLVMLSSPSSVLRGSVTAENVFGIGQSCTKQFQIGMWLVIHNYYLVVNNYYVI